MGIFRSHEQRAASSEILGLYSRHSKHGFANLNKFVKPLSPS